MKNFIADLLIHLFIDFFIACLVVIALCILEIIAKAIGILTLDWNTILIPGGIALIIVIIDCLIFIDVGNNS